MFPGGRGGSKCNKKAFESLSAFYGSLNLKLSGNMNDIKKYERILRWLRSHPLYDGSGVRDDQIFGMIGQAQRLLRKAREKQRIAPSVGPYSGLTRAELRQTGTCETDWF